MMRLSTFAALVISALSIFTVSPAARSQVAPKPVLRIPQLIAKDGDQAHPLSLSKANIDVVIDGYMAQTTMILTFANSGNRVLEGELVFPLPEGATVSGYGLDINGVMVDGVAVEKQKARRAYEREIRQRIDPGLLEHVSGNVFRTRVYPIPANGTRSIKVQYVSQTTATKDGIAYTLPLDWGQPVGRCEVRVDVLKASSSPQIGGKGFETTQFKQTDGIYDAKQSFENARLTDDLVISLPRPQAPISIERRTSSGEVYFAINDPIAVDANVPQAPKPSRIGILWDASMSRENADKTRETELLRALLTKIGNVDVDLVQFRNRVDAPKTFAIHDGNVDPLMQAIAATVYDGGTNFGAIVTPRYYGDLPGAMPQQAEIPNYAYWLVFSDGNGNLGDPMPIKGQVPVFAVSNNDRSNHALLRYYAQESGGAYLNLKALSNEQALETLEKPGFSFISADFEKGQIAEVYPAAGQPVHGQISVMGKLLAPQAQITLHFGYGTTITQSRTYTLRATDAAGEGLLPREWAQMKVADLAVFPDKNHDALLQVGQDFQLATPVTSLLVLETVEQYLRYGIRPPQSRPQVAMEYDKRLEQQKVVEKTTKEQKLQQVLAMWNDRVNWYDGKHDYPANFVFQQQQPQPGLPALDRTVAANSGPADRPASGLVRHEEQIQERRATNGPQTGRDGEAIAPAATPAPRPDASAPVFSLASDSDALKQARGADAGENLNRQGLFDEAAKRLEDDSKSERDARQPRYGDIAVAWKADVQIKEWDPNTPYLAAMKKSSPDKAYEIYLQQGKTYGSSPAFYLDCADYFLRNDQRELGLRILSDVAELQLGDARLLRIVAHRLLQLGEREAAIDLFEKILKMRPEEPQSHRDLALAIESRADDALASGNKFSMSAAADYSRALNLLNTVIMGDWDRFQGIQVVALMEANRIVARLKDLPGGDSIVIPLDPRLTRNLDLALRVVMTWDTDNTDVDLWVTEPSGEKCYYQHNRTTIGGLLSQDFTDGYGPEEYCLRKMMPGQYKIQANFFGSRQQALVGPTTVHATVITNFGRPNEQRQYLTLRLTDMKEVVDIGSVTLDAPVK